MNVLLPLAHLLLTTWLATQACALTGNQTDNFEVRNPALNSHQPGKFLFLKTVAPTQAKMKKPEINISCTQPPKPF